MRIFSGRDAVEFDDEDISSWRLLSQVYHLKVEWYRDSQQTQQMEQSCQLYEQSSRHAVALSGRQFTQQNWEHYASHHLLGHALVLLEEFKDAELILLEGFEGLDRLSADIPSSERRDYKITVTRLIELYGKWGKQEELQRWRQTAKRVR